MRIYAFADEASPSLEGQIAAMKRNGLQGIEIRNVDGQSVSDLSPEKARLIASRFEAEGLSAFSIGSPIGKIGIEGDDFDKHLERFRHTLEVAAILNAGRIRLFSFYPPKGERPEPYRQAVIDRLSRFVELADGSGVTLCHENEKGIYGDMADRCLDLLTSVPGLRGIFDPANFIQCGQETLSAWQTLKPHIEYLHIKDALADGHVVPAGKGIGHVRQIVREFIAMGGTSVTVEPHLKVFGGLEALEREQKTKVEEYGYATGDDAFDAACNALKALL